MDDVASLEPVRPESRRSRRPSWDSVIVDDMASLENRFRRNTFDEPRKMMEPPRKVVEPPKSDPKKRHIRNRSHYKNLRNSHVDTNIHETGMLAPTK